jgi:hypothetical protein
MITFRRGLPLLLAAILVQLAVPACKIVRHETTLKNGSVYRFQVRFHDPGDPLQGRYIQLDYALDYPSDQMIHPHSRYGVLGVNERGFAELTEIRMTPPDTSVDYISIYMHRNTPHLYSDRYYMKETIAPEAEKYFLSGLRDGTTSIWVDLRVHRGHSVIENIMIDGVPLPDAIKQQTSN